MIKNSLGKSVPEKIRFRAGRITSYITIPSGATWTTLIFNTTSQFTSLENPNSAYSTSTGIFTAPEAGLYFFSYGFRIKGTAGNDITTGFIKNSDTQVLYGYSFRIISTNYDGICGQDWIRLAAGDTVKLSGISGTGIAIDYDSSTFLGYFSGIKTNEL